MMGDELLAENTWLGAFLEAAATSSNNELPNATVEIDGSPSIERRYTLV
jgi:hypothetical protein